MRRRCFKHKKSTQTVQEICANAIRFEVSLVFNLRYHLVRNFLMLLSQYLVEWPGQSSTTATITQWKNVRQQLTAMFMIAMHTLSPIRHALEIKSGEESEYPAFFQNQIIVRTLYTGELSSE